MTRNDLLDVLRSKGVPEQMYSLDGLKNGECYCIVREGDRWKVVYMERGRVSEIETGLREHDAYDVLYRKFKDAYGWN